MISKRFILVFLVTFSVAHSTYSMPAWLSLPNVVHISCNKNTAYTWLLGAAGCGALCALLYTKIYKKNITPASKMLITIAHGCATYAPHDPAVARTGIYEESELDGDKLFVVQSSSSLWEHKPIDEHLEAIYRVVAKEAIQKNEKLDVRSALYSDVYAHLAYVIDEFKDYTKEKKIIFEIVISSRHGAQLEKEKIIAKALM